DRGCQPARGPRARLRRRPLRRARRGALRGPAAGRGEVRLGGGPHRADATGLRRRPADPGLMTETGFPEDVTIIPVTVGHVDPLEPVYDDDESCEDRSHLLPRERARRALSSVLPEAEMPVVGPESDGAAERGLVAAPRLARHVFRLSDGHEVGVTVSGRGIPRVMVHGFTAEGFLSAQPLSRLVSMGFKVVAIDAANHGSTQGLPSGGANFREYATLLGRALDELGIEQAFFVGHSMGGRVI